MKALGQTIHFLDTLKLRGISQKLDEIILTPSTKAESGHDIYLPKEEIIKKGMVDKDVYEQMEEAAIKLFRFGQEYCKKNGLIFGKISG